MHFRHISAKIQPNSKICSLLVLFGAKQHFNWGGEGEPGLLTNVFPCGWRSMVKKSDHKVKKSRKVKKS